MKKNTQILSVTVVTLVIISLGTIFYSSFFTSNPNITLTNLSMLHDWSKCNADFNLVNNGDSDVLVEVVFFEPHFTLDKEKVIHKSEFYISAHTTENKNASFYHSPCSQQYTDVRINVINKK